jgi:hypothetical protein
MAVSVSVAKIWTAMELRDLLLPGTHHRLRRTALAARRQIERAQLWRWEPVRLGRAGRPYPIVVYAGTRDRRGLAARLVGADTVDRIGWGAATRNAFEPEAALLTEAPIPGALTIPWSVHAVVPLGGSTEGVLAGYDVELRRRLRKERSEYQRRPVVADDEIAALESTMLAPYASHRHGDHVVHLRSTAVRATARGPGRLDLLLHREQPVACHLGYPLTVGGTRRWVSWRLGYPAEVFSDARRLRDVNSMNVHLALEWAVENGYDAYDLGACVANPRDGLLQWKRRRGGALDAGPSDGFFYLRLPRRGAVELLWDNPVLAVEGSALALHLGKPAEASDEQAMERYRELGFGGLARVTVHAAGMVSSRVIDFIQGLFRRHQPAPAVETTTG